MSEQLSLFDNSFDNLIDSNINLYKVAEEANAMATAMEISPKNEITDLSHALACLSSEDFERYVSAIRVIREVSTAYSYVTKNSTIKKTKTKILLEEPKEKVKEDTNKVKIKTSKVLFQDFLKKYLKDGLKRGRECMQAYIQESFPEYKSIDMESIPLSENAYISFHAYAKEIVNKSNGFWSLK